MNHTRKYGPSVAILAIALLLAGCGIKPDQLTPPSGNEDDFPHTYPAPDSK